MDIFLTGDRRVARLTEEEQGSAAIRLAIVGQAESDGSSWRLRLAVRNVWTWIRQDACWGGDRARVGQ
jgi:hypothetical protein